MSNYFRKSNIRKYIVFTILASCLHKGAVGLSARMMSNKIIQIGLTGSIGMGKSTVAKHFKDLGFKVFDADQAVNELYSINGDAVLPLQQLIPEAIINSQVDKKSLSTIITTKPNLLKDIEAIVHPLVRHKRELFYETAQKNGDILVVYDIPLLLENKDKYTHIDYIVVATASESTQRERVLARAGMTLEKFQFILSKQMSDNDKRQYADFLIHTDFPEYTSAKAQVASVVETILKTNKEIIQKFIYRKYQFGDNLRLNTDTILNRLVINPVTPSLSSSSSTCSSSSSSVSSPSSNLSIYYDTVIFDLDDTLLPTRPPLLEANKALIAYLEEKAPLTSAGVKNGQLPDIMKRIAMEQPLISHNLTEVRYQALSILSQSYNEYDPDLLTEAMNIFVQVRSHVSPYLYDDVIPCFEWLKQHNISIGILTNGNADLMSAEKFGEYISFSYTAADFGAPKPSSVPFIATLQRVDICPTRTLYIGDSYINDVIGSKLCGMHAVYLDRKGEYPLLSTKVGKANVGNTNEIMEMMDMITPKVSTSHTTANTTTTTTTTASTMSSQQTTDTTNTTSITTVSTSGPVTSMSPNNSTESTFYKSLQNNRDKYQQEHHDIVPDIVLHNLYPSHMMEKIQCYITSSLQDYKKN